jgi:hypothetical protein
MTGTNEVGSSLRSGSTDHVKKGECQKSILSQKVGKNKRTGSV